MKRLLVLLFIVGLAVSIGSSADAHWRPYRHKHSTTTTTTIPPTTTTTTPPRTPTAIGMSTPRSEWDARLAEVGPVYARRLFDQLSSFQDTIDLARSEINAGRYPILSFKVPNDCWSCAANGDYDTQLTNLRNALDALPGKVFVAIHHEPNGDGTATNFANMQRRVLSILRTPDNVDAGVIMNGFIFYQNNQGFTDAEIAQWLPTDVRALAEVIAGDFYQGGTVANPLVSAEPKIRAFSSWATRHGVTRLGVGETNGHSAETVAGAGDAILDDPRMVFGSFFNSSANSCTGCDWVLRGDEITAFKAIVARSRA
jgi:hypothetical protein